LEFLFFEKIELGIIVLGQMDNMPNVASGGA
jgi:hypothetical protein